MQRKTQTVLGIAGLIIILAFIVWQYSIEITAFHVFYSLIAGSILISIYYLLEERAQRRLIGSKTKYAIEYCKRWWLDAFGEHIDLSEGQMDSARFADYSNELFKAFIFTISSGVRKGREVKIVYSFADSDIFSFNVSPALSEVITPFAEVEPNRLSVKGYAPQAEEAKNSSQQAVGIPFIPLKRQNTEDSEFVQEDSEDAEQKRSKKLW